MATGRRERWAARENRRRHERYAKDLADWQASSAELDRLLNAAQSGQPLAAPSDDSMVLKRGETLCASLPQASLIEVQREPGHYQGGYSGFSFRVIKGVRYHVGGTRGTFVPGSEQRKIIDQGSAAITNQRVVFQGGLNSREWVFSKLIGVEHDNQRPISMIHVSNRKKVSGLAYPLDQTAQFRFGLALAIAQFQGKTAEFIAELQNEKAAHDQARPVQPAVAAPEQAPNGVLAVLSVLPVLLTGKKTWKRGWRAAYMAALLSIIITASVSSPKGTSNTAATGPAPTLSSSQVVETTPPPAAPAITSTPTHHATPKPRATATHTSTPTPTPTRTHKAVTVSLCGAPSNPWGYNFCGRGSYIYNPATDVCSYFNCIASFWNGSGYMTECSDGTYSMSGGRSGACSHHGGESQTVYSGSGPH